VIPLGLVYAGLAVPGTYLGLTLVSSLNFLVALAILKKNLRMGITPTKNYVDIEIKDLYKQLLTFSIPVFFINSGIAVLNNIDV